MTKSKRNRKNKKKADEVYKEVDPPMNLQEAVSKFHPLNNNSFLAFHRAACTRDISFLQTLTVTNYECATDFKYLPFPIVALCRNTNNNLLLIHGITQINIDNCDSPWNGRWVGFVGNDFTDNYSKVDMFVIRGKFTRPLRLYKKGPDFYNYILPEFYGNLPKLTNEDEDVDSCFTTKLLFLQPDSVLHLANSTMDFESVIPYLLNLGNSEQMCEEHQDTIINYAIGLIHKNISKLRLDSFNMTDKISNWRQQHLYKTYGNPQSPNKICNLLQYQAINAVTKVINEKHAEISNDVLQQLYKSKIGERLYRKIRDYMYKKQFIEAYYEGNPYIHGLVFLKQYPSFNGVVEINTESKSILAKTHNEMEENLMLNDLTLLVNDRTAPISKYNINFHYNSDDESIELVD